MTVWEYFDNNAFFAVLLFGSTASTIFAIGAGVLLSKVIGAFTNYVAIKQSIEHYREQKATAAGSLTDRAASESKVLGFSAHRGQEPADGGKKGH